MWKMETDQDEMMEIEEEEFSEHLSQLNECLMWGDCSDEHVPKQKL